MLLGQRVQVKGNSQPHVPVMGDRQHLRVTNSALGSERLAASLLWLQKQKDGVPGNGSFGSGENLEKIFAMAGEQPPSKTIRLRISHLYFGQKQTVNITRGSIKRRISRFVVISLT